MEGYNCISSNRPGLNNRTFYNRQQYKLKLFHFQILKSQHRVNFILPAREDSMQ